MPLSIFCELALTVSVGVMVMGWARVSMRSMVND